MPLGSAPARTYWPSTWIYWQFATHNKIYKGLEIGNYQAETGWAHSDRKEKTADTIENWKM